VCGRRCVGHNGAVYGFATVWSTPAEKLGVAWSRQRLRQWRRKKLADYALDLMLAERNGKETAKVRTASSVMQPRRSNWWAATD